MNRTLGWVVGVGCMGILLSTAAAAKDKPSDQNGKAPAAPTEAGAAQHEGAKPPEHVVYTFESDERMKAFGALWQKRQAMLLRMSVLKSYWEQEQESLNQLNKNLSTDYHLDLSKNYTLDAPRRMILEREVSAAGAAATGGVASSATPAPTTP